VEVEAVQIIGFIEETNVIGKILRHCGKWRKEIPRPPPQKSLGPPPMVAEPPLDYNFFEQNCI
jgi:hypothetical protein